MSKQFDKQFKVSFILLFLLHKRQPSLTAFSKILSYTCLFTLP